MKRGTTEGGVMEVEEAEKSKREPDIENFRQPDEKIERQSLKTVG